MAKSTGLKTRRRSSGEGSVYRSGGRWRGSIAWTNPDGSQSRRYVSGSTGAAAREKLDALRRDLRVGKLAPAGPTLTVGAYLAGSGRTDSDGRLIEGWIGRHRSHVRPSTWRTAESHVRVHLLPTLGRHGLARLSSAEVEAALAGMMAKGAFSAVSASHVRATLRTAMTAAQRDGLVSRNAAADARPPHVPHRSVTYLTASEVRRLLAATADEQLGPLYALAATTGLRRGELLGLRWSDIADGTLTVRRAVSRSSDGGWASAEPKSAHSRRTILLPASAREALERQRTRQDLHRARAGTAWQDRDHHVFTDAAGRPLLPEYVSHAFARSRQIAGIPPVRFHDLRHSAATMMLAEGVPLAVISEWLGHAGISITAAHYAAVVPALRREAADALDRAISPDV
jgi:integrase